MAKEQKDIQIAIIGTPAAGKTVFASVWAIRMTHKGDDNNPLSKRRGWVSLNTSDTALEVKDENNNVKSWTTFGYVDRHFRFLQSGPLTWTEPTLTEQRPRLRMTYHLDSKTYNIQMLDPPGHDLRAFFSPQSKMEDSDSISVYFNNSAFIFLIINLRDFFQHPVQTDGKNKRYAVTDTVEMYLQALNKLQESANNQKKRYVAVLWTAWKEYENKVNEAGGMTSFLKGLHLYDLHNLIHPSNPGTHFEIKEFFVDPVADTRANPEEATSEEHSRLPKEDFDSHNLETLSEWLAEMIRNIEASKISEEERENSAEGATEYGRLMFERNPVEAFNSFKKAIELDSNYADAHFCLGACYLNGRGVPKNSEEAYAKFKQAALLGSPSASISLQKIDDKYSDITKTFELKELRKDIAEVKILEAEMQHTKEQADAQAETAKQNADKRVKEVEQKASEAIAQAEIQSSIASAEKEKVEKQLANKNIVCVVLLIVSLLLAAVTIYKS